MNVELGQHCVVYQRRYGTALFTFDHSHALSREQYHISVKCMVKNSHFRLICSHDNNYCERYTRALGAISEFAHKILMSTR